MDSKNIIIVLLVIIILILACMVGAMFLPSLNAQKDSKIVITSNSTLYEGDNLTVKLTDLNKTPIEHAFVNVTITDGEGKVVVDESLKTNSKGKANLDMNLGPGKYEVNATFSGNDNYTGNSTTKKITIEEIVQEATVSSSDTSSSYSQEKTYASGLTDDEIEGYIQRDLNERAKNGVSSDYDYEGARQFYENVPPSGMR